MFEPSELNRIFTKAQPISHLKRIHARD